MAVVSGVAYLPVLHASGAASYLSESASNGRAGRQVRVIRSARFWAVVLVLVAALVALYRRGDTDRVPESAPLAQLPHKIGPWEGVDIPIPQESLDVLGKGDFLNRVYSVPGTAAPVVDGAPVSRQSTGLFIGYFPTQRSGQSIHSPQNCLPGAGWTFASSGIAEVPAPGGKVYQVGEYLIVNGNAKDEVLYWYQSHGRAIASDYKAKLYMLADSIRYNRTDAALVRIVVPLDHGEDVSDARKRALTFAQQTIPLLPTYIPN